MPYVNVFHAFLAANSVSSDGQLGTWQSAFHTALTSSGLLQPFSNTLHVTEISSVLFINDVLVYRATGAISESGTQPVAAIDASASICISWNSSAYWRGGKPRTYMGGVVPGMIDTNHSLLDSSKADIQARANSFLNDVNAITTAQIPETTMCFTSYQSKGEWRTPPLNFAITGAIIHDRLASQRRRLGPWLP